jgi:hypothetical protein
MTWKLIAQSNDFSSQNFHDLTRAEVIQKMLNLMERGYTDFRVEK